MNAVKVVALVAVLSGVAFVSASPIATPRPSPTLAPDSETMNVSEPILHKPVLTPTPAPHSPRVNGTKRGSSFCTEEDEYNGICTAGEVYEECTQKEELESRADELNSIISDLQNDYDTAGTYWSIIASLDSSSAYNTWYKELTTGYKWPLDCTEETITGVVSDSDENGITGVVRSFTTTTCEKATTNSDDTYVWENYFSSSASYSEQDYADGLKKLYEQQKSYNSSLDEYTDQVDSLDAEISASDCSGLTEVIYDLVTMNGDAASAMSSWFSQVECEAANAGLVLAALAVDKLVDTVLIATVPVLGEWIAAMQAEPACESVYDTDTWSITLGNTVYTYDKVTELVTDLFCYFEDEISLFEDISWISKVCTDTKEAEQVVDGIIDIACGNEISALMDFLKPIILCQISVDGTTCGQQLGYTWYC
eukprot:CAMPEP_0185847740 /NCGR_PEP_ID=MMETSP1354-20130828/2897_1 /TAXON_ID=708628 /ORGANISM="Erythrolobus madagascarensis, Strain CCMP3276" /LENGTH=423 /DNA_ID=CAMNT_0028548069 /DNA_START=141 /DNA_END=1412 /DNA_ORIENTATION=+